MKFRLNWLKLIPHVDFLTPLPGIYGSSWCYSLHQNARMQYDLGFCWILWEVLASICGNSGSHRGSTRTVDPTWSFQRKPCVLVHFFDLFWVNCKLAIFKIEWLFQWYLVSLIYRCLSLFIQCLSSMILFLLFGTTLFSVGAVLWTSWISTANHSMQTWNWWGTVDPFTMDASR